MSDGGEPARRGTKAGRNKRRDLFASLLNNLSAAAVIGSLLQPALTLLREGEPFTSGDLAAVLVLNAIGTILHFAAQRVGSRLED